MYLAAFGLFAWMFMTMLGLLTFGILLSFISVSHYEIPCHNTTCYTIPNGTTMSATAAIFYNNKVVICGFAASIISGIMIILWFTFQLCIPSKMAIDHRNEGNDLELDALLDMGHDE